MTKSFDEEEYEAELADRQASGPPQEALAAASEQARDALGAALTWLDRLSAARLEEAEALAGAAVLGRLTSEIDAAVEALEALIRGGHSRPG